MSSGSPAQQSATDKKQAQATTVVKGDFGALFALAYPPASATWKPDAYVYRLCSPKTTSMFVLEPYKVSIAIAVIVVESPGPAIAFEKHDHDPGNAAERSAALHACTDITTVQANVMNASAEINKMKHSLEELTHFAAAESKRGAHAADLMNAATVQLDGYLNGISAILSERKKQLDIALHKKVCEAIPRSEFRFITEKETPLLAHAVNVSTEDLYVSLESLHCPAVEHGQVTVIKPGTAISLPFETLNSLQINVKVAGKVDSGVAKELLRAKWRVSDAFSTLQPVVTAKVDALSPTTPFKPNPLLRVFDEKGKIVPYDGDFKLWTANDRAIIRAVANPKITKTIQRRDEFIETHKVPGKKLLDTSTLALSSLVPGSKLLCSLCAKPGVLDAVLYPCGHGSVHFACYEGMHPKTRAVRCSVCLEVATALFCL